MIPGERLEQVLMIKREDNAMNPLVAQLTHRPFPEVAEALRSEADRITMAWDAAVRDAMPQMRHLTFDELKDSTPQILHAIADALASDDPKVIRELVRRAPAQGLSRLELNFDVIEVMQEDRLLRAITVLHVEAGLGRRMDVPESAALHAAIDVMLQRSVIALVEEQKAQLRAAAETELKFLSFLSHDLNNHLNGVTLWLHVLGNDLKKAGGFGEAEESLGVARQSIVDTVTGMRRMLDHERLRKSGEGAKFSAVDLHAAATRVVAQFAREADEKGVKLAVEVPAGTVAESDPELLGMVLQNLVGNGVKYSSGGTVRVGSGGEAGAAHEAGRPVLWVSDQGPGIAPEEVEHIFEAFKRGEVHGQRGVGLGLAIASQAAKLLGAALTVESKVGTGSTFRLALPESSHDASEGHDTNNYPGLPPGMNAAPAANEGSFRGPINRGEVPLKPDAAFPPAPPRGLRPAELEAQPLAVQDPPALPDTVLQLLTSKGHALYREREDAKPKILVVDEDVDTVREVAKLLRLQKYDPHPAGGYAEARAAALTTRFDVLLADLGMPDGDGCDLLREIRSVYDIEGVAVTECGTPADLRRARDAGFAFHLLKPVTIERLESAIDEVMRRKHQPAGPAGVNV